MCLRSFKNPTPPASVPCFTHPENSEDAITESLGYLMLNWRETSGIISQVRSHGLSFLLHSPLLHAPSSPATTCDTPRRVPGELSYCLSFYPHCFLSSCSILAFISIQGWMLVCGPEASTIFWVGKASVRKDLIMNTKLGMKINVWSEK